MAARAARLKVGVQFVADEWSAKAALWESVGRQIENTYEAAVEAIEALTNATTAKEDVAAIVDQLVWP